jgi:hypothetical protein
VPAEGGSGLLPESGATVTSSCSFGALSAFPGVAVSSSPSLPEEEKLSNDLFPILRQPFTSQSLFRAEEQPRSHRCHQV